MLITNKKPVAEIIAITLKILEQKIIILTFKWLQF